MKDALKKQRRKLKRKRRQQPTRQMLRDKAGGKDQPTPEQQAWRDDRNERIC